MARHPAALGTRRAVALVAALFAVLAASAAVHAWRGAPTHQTATAELQNPGEAR